MLVRQNKYNNMGLGAQPFIAIAVCGRAHEAGEHSDRTDDFLRAAEPAEHDMWTHATTALGTDYKTLGVMKMLSDFVAAIKSKVKELVTIPQREGGSAPECILKDLRFSSGTGGGGHQHYISVTRMRTEPTDEGEIFKFHARKIRPEDEKPWQIEVKLFCMADAGGQAEKIEAITEVECAEMLSYKEKKGVALIKFTPDVTKAKVRIEIREDKMPVAFGRCKREFRVDGRSIVLEETEVI